MRLRWLILLHILAGVARAHDVTILPSLCTFQPVLVSAPDAGFAATAAAPGASDTFRIVYDVGSSESQFCPADPADSTHCAPTSPARAFSGAGVSGAVTLPLFQARVLASGDLVAESVPVLFTVGAATATVMMPLTTGLVAAGSGLAQGSPIDANGSLTLVGAGAAAGLPPPLGGTPLLLRMTCVATPKPDLDQFRVPTRTKALAGTIRADGVRVRAKLRVGAELATPAPDFGTPGLVMLSAAGSTLAVADFPAGLLAKGRRKFIGQTADGTGTVIVRAGSGKGSYALSLRLPAAILPAAGAPAGVELTYQLGGMFSRATRTFRPAGKGLRAL